MLTVLLILSVAALIAAILSLMGKCPVIVPVLLVTIIACLDHIPLGR